MYSEILFIRSISRNVFIVDITMEELAEDSDYRESIRAFGEDAIEIGGAIEDEHGAVLAVIPSRRIRISELPQSPVRQSFPISVYGEQARSIALAWYEQTKGRISDFISAKITRFDDFSTETTIHVA